LQKTRAEVRLGGVLTEWLFIQPKLGETSTEKHNRMRTARSLQPARAAAPAGDKREAIMRAATKVFARSGYFNSKVADVAREAGVADGTVYLYFKSKEEILRSIFERNTSEAVRAGREELAKIEDPREKLRRIARHHLERLGADRDLAVVFQVELRGTTKFMEEFSAAGLAEYLGLIREVFEEGQAAGFFRKSLKPKLVAKILFGALDEMATNWILSRRRYKLAPMADEVLDIFLGGVSA
jgi:TetR/AcrR family fatty acid metabolism transcriptional regulator